MLLVNKHSFLNANLTVASHNSDAGDRDVLINAARELYGDEAVIPVSNFNTLKLKTLVQDISRAQGIDHTEVIKVTKNLEKEVEPFARDENTEKSVFVLMHDDCMKYSKKYKDFMEKYPLVKKHIETLFMENRNLSRHAGGVIIADPLVLEKTMPLIKVKNDLQTPWTEGMNFRNLEDNGFIKFDFLGLSLLEDVRNCIRRILQSEGNPNPTFSDIKQFFDKHLNCRYVEPNDPRVFKTAYCQKDFPPNIFQFTNSGARQFCYEAQPDNITEIGAITAIYRPGPLKADVHKMYVKTKQSVLNGEKIKYDHPVIEEILGPTLGYLVFQEQFMLLAQKLSGFSPAESDKLRKTLVKKSLDTIGKKGDEREEAKERFVEGAKRLHGIKESILLDLWDKIVFFSLYGFNSSCTFDTLIDIYDHEGNFIKSEEIQNINPGDYVKTRDEETQEDTFTKVLNNHDHGKIPTYEIVLETGEKFTCSMEHKFRVEDGRMLPLWYIIQEDLSIVSAAKNTQQK